MKTKKGQLPEDPDLSPEDEAALERAWAELDVESFAAEKGVGRYVEAAIDLARQAFPASALSVSVDRDAEEEAHRYIALDIDTADLTAEELLAGQTVWSAGLGRVCPSRFAVYFVLGWR